MVAEGTEYEDVAFEELRPGRHLEVCWAEDTLWRDAVVYSFGPTRELAGERLLYYPQLLEWELLGLPSHSSVALVIGRRPMPHLLTPAEGGTAARPSPSAAEKLLIELELWWARAIEAGQIVHNPGNPCVALFSCHSLQKRCAMRGMLQICRNLRQWSTCGRM